ncbi:MAG: dethiobiotin synthase [Thermodesulfobacteriota bacterium]
MNAIFVAGTDTDVGKTWVTGLLLAFLREQGIEAGYQKWAATGAGYPPADLCHCLETAGMVLQPELLADQVVFHFGLAASPHLAAEQEGRQVEAEAIRQSFARLISRYELLVVEGVGGLMVPLRRDLLLIDLLAELVIPTVLVARSGLGTINHTLLSIEALRQRAIPLLGVVCSDAQPTEDSAIVADNLRTIAELGRLPVYGRLPHCSNTAEAKAMFGPIGDAILASLYRG